jgi:2-methylaconitate cis-trans-isomerase PrpF
VRVLDNVVADAGLIGVDALDGSPVVLDALDAADDDGVAFPSGKTWR